MKMPILSNSYTFSLIFIFQIFYQFKAAHFSFRFKFFSYFIYSFQIQDIFSAISLKSCFFSSSSFEPFSSKACFNPRCLLSTESFSFLGRYPTHSIPVNRSIASFRFKYSFSDKTLFKITPFILTFSSNNLNPRISAECL